MTNTHGEITAASSRLREYLERPVGSEPQDLRPVIAPLTATVAHSDQCGPMVSETVLVLYRIILKTKDSHTIRVCLEGLLGLGRFGRLLAARYVHSKPFPLRELAAMVASFPVQARLALVHEMLLGYPGANDKPTLDWLEQLTASLTDTDPEETIPFLATLGRHDEALAYPLRQALYAASFDTWLTARLQSRPKGEAFDNLCHAVVALDDPAHAHTLAVSIRLGILKATPLALDVIARVAEAGNKPVMEMFLTVLKTRHRDLAGHCIDGFLAQHASNTGKMLATIRKKLPALAATVNSRAPLLGEAGYLAYLRALPTDLRAQARDAAWAALHTLAPCFVHGQTTPQASGTSLDTTHADNEEQAPAEPCPKEGLIRRMMGKRPATLEKLIPKVRNFRDLDLRCSHVTDEELDGRDLMGLDLANSDFADTAFIRCTVSRCRLNASRINNNTITATTFNATDFTGADCNGTTFIKCSFSDCTFTGAAFANCRFDHCRFSNCSLVGSALLNTRITHTGFTSSTLAGATVFETTVRSSRFTETDFTEADIRGSRFSGVEFAHAVFLRTAVLDSALHAVDMPGSTVHDCPVANCDASHALWLTNRLRQLTVTARRLEQNTPKPPAPTTPEAAHKALTIWARELDILRREARMQAHNRNRLARALDGLPASARIYLSILPHLLQSRSLEQTLDVQNVPSCSVWGYTPGLSTLESTQQFFREPEPESGNADVQIVAVYAMGSLGSIAQTAQSDIDCWVCYEGDLTPDVEAGLRRKLLALEDWAESAFALEAHFFPMRMEDVRGNRFASGDEESSGSAQALLLKEEFYRTALRLAGKSIAWWVTPPGADKEAYAACMHTARRYPARGTPRLEDFGYLAPVPPDEYFGGSLWQMVKAVHSPFKSVLKLGLLETYADPAGSRLPLCDRIKQNIFLRRRGIKRTDPYAALFATLRAYHARRKDTEAARLLSEAFLYKANVCGIPLFRGLPARPEHAGLIRTLFGPSHGAPATLCSAETTWSFDKSLHMGREVRQHMVKTYQSIRDGMRGNDSAGARINSEDLTRMGRRIGANFLRKQHKVMRVPFMDPGATRFPLLHFSAQKAPGRKPIWMVRGGASDEAKKSADSLQLLHRSGDPAIMAAWLLANGMYHPKSLLQADRTIAPISVADLQKLMAAMHDFFPHDATFERDINEGLESERVDRVFFIFNLLNPPDAKRVEQAWAVYSTNWGEMFCRSFTNPGPLLEEHPPRFLAEHLDQPVSSTPDMALFLPKGAQCKRINLI